MQTAPIHFRSGACSIRVMAVVLAKSKKWDGQIIELKVVLGVL